MSSPFLSFDPFLLFFNDFLIFFSLFSVLIFPVFPFFVVKLVSQNTNNLFPSLSFSNTGVWELLFSLFIYLSVFNLVSLWGFVFSPFPHLLITLSLGVVFWLSTFLLQTTLFAFRKCEHLAPPSTPFFLLSLMVFIELVSQIIRPLTLSVRLAANLTAGHLILSLLSSMGLMWGAIGQIFLIILEALVSLVQPFVFCILLFLYFSENYGIPFSSFSYCFP